MKSGMDRRSFLTGAAATGALAAFGLAGCTEKAMEASEGSMSGSGVGTETDASSYLNPGSYTVGETANYDVVVVGGGGAGMSAATRAAELGLETVLLEQHPTTGGTSLFTEGLFALDSHIQKENGKNPADLGYDIYTMAMDYHHWYANGNLFRKYCNDSGGDIAWMEEQGIVFTGTSTMCGNEYNTWHLYEYTEGQPSGYNYVTQWAAAVEAAGATIVTGSEAVDIIVDDGAAKAIVAKEGDTYKQYNASKGIILATGGYSDNSDMIREFGKNPDRIQPMGAGGRMGFGINAARKAGGVLAPSPGCIVPYGGCIPGIDYGTHLYCASAFQPYFWVNQDAKRFVNEYYAERNFSFSGDAQAMQDRVISIVTQAQMDTMYEHGGTFGCGEYIHAGEPLTMLWDQLKEQQDAGNEAVHGPIDTIDELAKELGLDADALKSEINAYNGYCKEKKDLEFNKDPQYLFALDEGPYYAFELKVGIFSTVGGMKINNDCQVLDEKNMPIANLYAAGCDAGGLYGDAYDVSICEGSCQGFAVFTGKTAAEACAGKGEFATA